jgi:hypothetical protein
MKLDEIYQEYRKVFSYTFGRVKNSADIKDVIGKASVELHTKTYSNVRLSMVPYNESSGIHWGRIIPRRVNLDYRADIRISTLDLDDFERFVFVLGHEFGHLEQEALDAHHQLVAEEKAKGNYAINYRFSVVEIIADEFGNDLFNSIFGYDFPIGKFKDILGETKSDESRFRITCLHSN